MMTIKGIVFDMDDTLYDEKDYIFSGFKAVDQWIKAQFQVDGFFETATYFFSLGQKKLVFNHTLQKLQIKYNEDLITELVHHYRSHDPQIYLLEDANWVLDHLTKSVKIGLISDGFLVSQQKKVEALKLNERFHSIILSDRFGRENWKPSSVPYEEVSRELLLSHHECVYIGDNATKDFIGAKKLGWTTVRIRRADSLYSDDVVEQEYNADFEIDNLTRIKDIPVLKHLIVEDVNSYQ